MLQNDEPEHEVCNMLRPSMLWFVHIIVVNGPQHYNYKYCIEVIHIQSPYIYAAVSKLMVANGRVMVSSYGSS